MSLARLIDEAYKRGLRVGLALEPPPRGTSVSDRVNPGRLLIELRQGQDRRCLDASRDWVEAGHELEVEAARMLRRFSTRRTR